MASEIQNSGRRRRRLPGLAPHRGGRGLVGDRVNCAEAGLVDIGYEVLLARAMPLNEF